MLIRASGKAIYMVKIVKVLKKRDTNLDGTDKTVEISVDQGHAQTNTFGWISPQYTESRRVKLDRRVLEKNRIIGLLDESAESGYYKVVRAQIRQRMRANGWNTLMVTSVHPGEGKTLTAINLAAMFAKEFDQTVMLVDADLNTPSIHRCLGYESHSGLGDYLLGKKDLKEIIVWAGVEKLTIISGGKGFSQGTEVLNSPRMCSLVDEMKNRYNDRYLFFDVPSVLGQADAMVFADLVDAIVLVVQDGKTPMPDIRKALEYLPTEKFLGYIMNQT